MHLFELYKTIEKVHTDAQIAKHVPSIWIIEPSAWLYILEIGAVSKRRECSGRMWHYIEDLQIKIDYRLPLHRVNLMSGYRDKKVVGGFTVDICSNCDGDRRYNLMGAENRVKPVWSECGCQRNKPELFA
jgi:hypothetical protein